MDKYSRILVIIVVLIYANALFLYFLGPKISAEFGKTDINEPNVDIPEGPLVSFENTPTEEVKTTKEGHTIKEEYGSGTIKIQNFTFDQEASRIKTVLMSFKTLKIQPKPYCWEEQVTENVTVKVPKITGFSASQVEKIENDANVGFDPFPKVKDGDKIVDKYGSEMPTTEKDENSSEYEHFSQVVSYYVTKCQTAEDIFLASIFGTVDIMKNQEALATYSLTFRKEERDDKLYDYLVVEKDIFLPDEPGRYELRVIIWDKISGNRVTHNEEFFVK